MGLFRRREPLHEQLAREGGLRDTPAPDPRPGWQETGIHGIHRPREWDVTLSADADIAEGTRVTFVALPDDTLLVEDGDVPDATPLAERVERELPAPYRARGARRRLDDPGEEDRGGRDPRRPRGRHDRTERGRRPRRRRARLRHDSGARKSGGRRACGTARPNTALIWRG